MTCFTNGYVRDLESLGIDNSTLKELGKFATALEIDIRQFFDDIKEDN